MNFEDVALQYLARLCDEYATAQSAGQHTPELSYRPALDDFFHNVANAIEPRIKAVFEPKKQVSSGRPDWRFHDSVTLGVYGYAEAKPLNLSQKLKATAHEDQITKYKELGCKIILSDGLDFIFIDPQRGISKGFGLVDKPISLTKLRRVRPTPLLEAQFREFFRSAGSRHCTEEELVGEVAARATRLSEQVELLSEAPAGSGASAEENRTIVALHELRGILAHHHDPVLRTSKAFADFVVQVLMFGLLYAHRVVRREGGTPIDRYERIQKFWSDVVYREYASRLRPFQELVRLFGRSLEHPGALGTWYDDCRLMLAHVQLKEAQTTSPEYHTLFEHFLEVYDPAARFDFGAFYTPPELAFFSVRLAQSVTAEYLPGRTLYDAGNKLIDPCCGTGTFIEKLIKNADAGEILAQIIGFEILPAPYALAHYRLTMLGSSAYPAKTSIVLTDTLSDLLEEPGDGSSAHPMAAEQNMARKFSRPPITLVIGNPPSSDSSRRRDVPNQSIIKGLIDDWRPPISQRKARQNIQKQLTNEFVKFLRWACNKLSEREPGIVAFILPASFAENPSYRFVRKWLLKFFCRVWVLDLDRDARSGIRTESLFLTLQGRLLLVGVRDTAAEAGALHLVFYCSIADMSRENKRIMLSAERTNSALLSLFAPIEVTATSYSFRPVPSYDKDLYERFWPLHKGASGQTVLGKYIFERHCSGIKLAPSSLFVHTNCASLVRRTREAAIPSFSYSAFIKRWYQGQSKPPGRHKLSEKVRQKLRAVAIRSEPYIFDYAYRPFVTVSALLYEPVLQMLSHSGGGGTRYRPEILKAFGSSKTFGIAVSPAPKDIGESLHRFVSFCWRHPDNDLAKRGNGRVFCNIFPENKPPKGKWNNALKSNVNPELTRRLLHVTMGDSRSASDLLVFYCYAVLCSDAYLDAFQGALFTLDLAENWPRIPIAASPDLFLTIAKKGKLLAELEDARKPIVLSNELEAAKTAFPGAFSLHGFDVGKVLGQVRLMDDSGVKVVIPGVSDAVISFLVSGYYPIQEWLKIHSWAYSRTDFNESQFSELLMLIQRINAQVALVKAIDEAVRTLLSGEAELM